MTVAKVRADGLLSGAYNTGGDIAREVLELVRDPRNALAVFAPDKLRQIDRYSHRVDIAKCVFFSVVIFVCALRLVLCIPGDYRIEKAILARFDTQRRRECMRDYAANNCATTMLPHLVEYCARLELCIEDEGEAARMTRLRFLASVVNEFFYFLTPKAAAGLGVISAVILYINLLR